MSGARYLPIKYAIDRLIALALLILLLPFFLVIGIAIVFDSGRPIFFIQARVGKSGQIFHVYKFRTMVQDAALLGLGTTVSSQDSRITRVGLFLRAWSLDELPQLLNVVRGEMSLVGPRPTLAYQVEQYTPEQRLRLEVKPGITGWAQVNGRNALPWVKRIELDMWYVEHLSLWLDLRILVRTIGVFCRREGLYGSGGVNDDFRTNKNA